MIRDYAFRLFFLICAAIILVHLFEMDRTQLFSFNSAILLGVLMLCVELSLKLKLNPPPLTFNQPKKIRTISTASSDPTRYSYLGSKIGCMTIVASYILESLTV